MDERCHCLGDCAERHGLAALGTPEVYRGRRKAETRVPLPRALHPHRRPETYYGQSRIGLDFVLQQYAATAVPVQVRRGERPIE